MKDGPASADGIAATLDRPLELELADGTRLVARPEACATRIEGDPDHAFTLADVQRTGGEPFEGYRLLRD